MKMRVEQLGALGQADRLQIFRLLVRAEPAGKCVDEIRRRLKMPGSTLSHHLDTLTRSSLLTARRAGRFIYCAVNWRETAALSGFSPKIVAPTCICAWTRPVQNRPGRATAIAADAAMKPSGSPQTACVYTPNLPEAQNG